MRVFLTILVLIITAPAWAEEVVLGLSKDKVAITATFDGSEILVFGAVKRETAIPDGPLDVIVAVAGPLEPIVVRRKEKRFGIWVNIDAVEVDAAPSFYAIATTRPLETILSNVEDLRHGISIPRAIRSVGAPSSVQDAQAFTDAVIRIRKDNGSYALRESTVSLDQETLFRTSIKLPSNLTEGDYQARIYLLREGRIISDFATTIDVQKVGLERWLFNLSREMPLIYGLMSLAIAIFAGWSASAAFQAFRQR